jgi:hypothetical protein
MTDTIASTAPCKPAAGYRTGGIRSDGWTPERQATFLLIFAQTGLVNRACRAANMSVTSAYELRHEPRGVAFDLGWKAAHLMARDVLEDRLLEAALEGVESVSERDGDVTIRRALNAGLSMGVLNRLDRRLAALDDQAIAVARAIGAGFEDFIVLVMNGGGADEIARFLASHPDPLAAQVALAQARAPDPAPQLAEKSAIPAPRPSAPARVVTIIPGSPVCDCPADRDPALLELV